MTQDEEFVPTIVVVQIKGNLGGKDAEASKKIFSDTLSQIAIESAKNGATLIGHIKANFNAGDGGLLSISCTTDDGKIRMKTDLTGAVNEYISVMNVIVYGVDYDCLQKITDDALGSIPGTKNIEYIKESGCNDPDCHDPDCKDPDHRKIISIM